MRLFDRALVRAARALSCVSGGRPRALELLRGSLDSDLLRDDDCRSRLADRLRRFLSSRFLGVLGRERFNGSVGLLPRLTDLDRSSFELSFLWTFLGLLLLIRARLLPVLRWGDMVRIGAGDLPRMLPLELSLLMTLFRAGDLPRMCSALSELVLAVLELTSLEAAFSTKHLESDCSAEGLSMKKCLLLPLRLRVVVDIFFTQRSFDRALLVVFCGE